MHLSQVHIEHFRGIPRLTLPLDPVTVVIGENNRGKTSILDVLGLCLGRPGEPVPTRFRDHDFHRPAGGDGAVRPIRLRLSFEAGPGGLSTTEEEELAPALVEGPAGGRELHVEFIGTPDGEPLRTRFLDAAGEALEPQPPEGVLVALRRLHPVLLLRFAHDAPLRGPGPKSQAFPGREERRSERALEGQIGRVYRELMDTRGPVPPDHLDQGLAAARTLFERIQARRGGAADPLGRILGELVGAANGDGGRTDAALARAGSGSHTLGLLLVLGALLDVRGTSHLPREAHPLIAIEEPEVHLHPILLASTWDVIESLSAQTLVTTHSGELLASVPLGHLRRLARRDGEVDVRRLRPGTLSGTDLRRVAYHVRAKRGSALFARCWLLVEGESEFWLMRGLAQLLGYDLDAEGVHCVEFAQCGVEPLVELADDLGIGWHLLADGDESGALYHHDATRHLDGRPVATRITRLEHPDVERALWEHGYADLYREAAGVGAPGRNPKGRSPEWVIAKAVRKASKPYLALSAVEAVAKRGADGVPAGLRHAVEASVRLARASGDRASAPAAASGG
jgi:putative ATP-dependent endonuclease of OLD family